MRSLREALPACHRLAMRIRPLCDPDHPTRMLPIYDCGDHLHPSDLGYRTMGDAIDLGLFD